MSTNERLFDRIWNEGIISFDTSSLLRIFEWSHENAIEFKDVLDYGIERIWIPFYVYYEFQRQKEGVMLYDKFQQIFSHLERVPIRWKSINKILSRWERRGFDEKFTSIIAQMEKEGVNETNKSVLLHLANTIKENYIESLSVDILHNSMFENIGVGFNKQKEHNLRERFICDPNAVGWMDKKKKNNNEHNDYFIWNEVKEQSTSAKKDVIFVTSDIKEDWFEDKINLIPRNTLITEFRNETQHEIIIISLTEFLQQCSRFLGKDLDELINAAKLSSIQNQIIEIYESWFPKDILEKINEYTEEDDSIKDAMELSLKCVIDMVSFEGITDIDVDIENINWEVSDEYDEVYIDLSFLITCDFDANNHMCNEDITIDTVPVTLQVFLTSTLPIEWESLDSGRKALGNILENIEIQDIKLDSCVEMIEEDDEFDESFIDDYEDDYEPEEEFYDCDYDDEDIY